MKNRSWPNIFSSESLYKKFFKPILAKDEGVDAEQLTQLALNSLRQASLYRNWPGISQALTQLEIELNRKDPRLEQKIFGCHFKNPLGLAAGFDKNGIAAGIWNNFGFGFAELGTVTWHAQEGNPKPRLFRLSKEKAALNRMGFNNNGAVTMRDILERQKLKSPGNRSSLIGLNLGKSKVTPLEQAHEDYASSLEILSSFADYAVINVSSPNTPNLRKLQDAKALRRLIKRLRRLPSCPPLLVKIAPDLDNIAIDSLTTVAFEEGLAGIIAVNTSIDRLGLENRIIAQTKNPLSQENGGLSGRPLRGRAIEIIQRLRKNAGADLTLIGVGGIDTPESAWERITAGASLIQIYTGWIFEGPALVPKILEGLVLQLDRHGFKNISEAVGSNVPWI
ncbi:MULTISPECIES: quinone-dependent dihydroorotate dehydrogenase [Prochlorococcus]|uniref:Dihydroorotate dehydrogenase (quinone) n=1 Tax=Prochlorococcus marinus (strain SARG / CCMP1375 / SS120) TaxID=167539 RepID=Q7VDZ0_PROMA|nr:MULTISPECIES: quinone-dependent dihydroorotate dehydrogenase [Prochlorococcus]AAP99271.1 Dihydroorotate dehydrogenase [Prochlorococcus marinus subsp. marinus str. CCMP1375]KGG11459.1 Dihydroorotate dehydrogenase [Prochlorococcus marinus str. LG]KGG18586.1 Dihydroorotate dehydrogenase [Prochlorococcus marinus str. SS2]KGG22859.1 Dihydroorotate dehydrogenase [Prochlorococcus marinus str. SS35]KGG32735.1 Dihydroorotate dehydrogenase [Prochlorococcus marinus str. SS51]